MSFREETRRSKSLVRARILTSDVQDSSSRFVRYVVITATQAGRNWVVTSSTEDLVPLYRFVGLRDVGIAYNHPDLNDLKHIVLIADTREALTGRSVGPTAWNQVYRDALQYQYQVAAARLGKILSRGSALRSIDRWAHS